MTPTVKLINRQNYEEIEEFLKYQAEIRQNDALTVDRYYNYLMHLLKWAWEKELRGGPKIKPGFVEYLDGLRIRGGRRISSHYFVAICSVARMFFEYQRERHRNAYARVAMDWVESLHPPRLRSELATVAKRDIYTLEDTVRLATWPTDSLRHKRTQAGVAFLFLTGMRIGAFMSLPINCVDLENMKVKQFPQLGVKTKFKKAAVTTILPVEELLGVVRDWDGRVRGELAGEGMWFPNLLRLKSDELDPAMPKSKLRSKDFYRNLQDLCELAGVRYLSPHKFRHGHAVFGLKRSSNMQEWKAVSQNLMHSSTGITDQIYGALVQDDQHETMLEIGRKDERDAGEVHDAGIDYDRLADAIARKMKN